jgi:hypothetical protein
MPTPTDRTMSFSNFIPWESDHLPSKRNLALRWEKEEILISMVNLTDAIKCVRGPPSGSNPWIRPNKLSEMKKYE